MASKSRQEDTVAPQLGGRARSELDRCSAVEKVIAVVHERSDRPFSIDEMAGIAYLSRFYFNRGFHEATGLPPVRFQTALRIAAAKRLLLTTGLSVTEVCLEVGYQSLGTFTTHFHELVGLSPELRRLSAEPAAAAVDRFASVDDAAGAPAVEGEIVGAGDGRVVFVALFAQPYSQGFPAARTTVTGSAPYQLRTTTDWNVLRDGGRVLGRRRAAARGSHAPARPAGAGPQQQG